VEAFAIERLSFAYPAREGWALDGIDLVVGQGELLVLCGPSGCGKTTLLRQLKPSLAPFGRRQGRISWEGRPLEELSHRDEAAGIGFVMQSPDNQVVTDKVWHELAFGLESLGCDTPTIRLRVAEMASFFGIQDWFHRRVSELSGGQRQLLALASVMAMQPSVLICDEPTAQLDPIAATEFLQTVGRINRELGTTVILTEHRLDEALALASRAVVMDAGRVVASGAPTEVAEQLRAAHSAMFHAMPVPLRTWAAVPNGLPCPLSVRDGRRWLDAMLAAGGAGDVGGGAGAAGAGAAGAGGGASAGAASAGGGASAGATGGGAGAGNVNDAEPVRGTHTPSSTAPAAIELDEVWFRYDRELPNVVRGASFKAWPGQVTAVLGGNGTGKTTMLSLIAGLNRPWRGTVRLEGQRLEDIPRSRLFNGLLGMLPQNPQALFVGRTVADDLGEMLKDRRIPPREQQARMLRMAALCRLDGLLPFHPYDLSGGEQQRLALAKVLLLQPRIVLLDEPTKGFDAQFKATFAAILRELTKAGVAVVMVSHDIEFCAEHADRCALFFDGEVVTEGVPRDFFSGNSFYTSAANRMARHVFPQAITAADVVRALGGTIGTGGDSGTGTGTGDDRGTGVGTGTDGDVAATAATDGAGDSAAATATASASSDVAIVTHAPAPAATAAAAVTGTVSSDDSTATAATVSADDNTGTASTTGTANADDSAIATAGAPGTSVTWRTRLCTRTPGALVAASLALVGLLAGVVLALMDLEGLKSFVSGGDLAVGTAAAPGAALRYCGTMLLIAASLAALVFALSWKRGVADAAAKGVAEAATDGGSALVPAYAPVRQKLPARTLMAAGMALLAIPLTIFVGIAFLDDRRYYLTSLLILVEAMLPFVFVFEGRRPQAREIVVIAVLCAIAVAGRGAFFMLPSFKPVVALVIIAAVAFGGEAGFLVGALSAFVSNMFFGQGPWTPWQMFAFGIIGFIAGVLFQKGLLSRNRGALAVFGALAALVLYGLVMDTAATLIYQPNPGPGMFLAYYLQGIPFNLVHASATVLFLLILARPMLEKLDRIKEKYGLVRT
jgi:energy-coupling factor transporter ATP-binding protein EcfA2/uncharacterized membrane protein